jgi:hypothetical protein
MRAVKLYVATVNTLEELVHDEQVLAKRLHGGA